jgi:hypothetical protein
VRRSARRARGGSPIVVTRRTVRARNTRTIAIALAIALVIAVAGAVALATGGITLWALAATTRPAPRAPAPGPGGPVLVVTDRADAFGGYYAEILRAEGLNEFAVTDTTGLSAATLARHQVVLLAQTTLTDAQEALLSAWVHHGGNLIAMRPDARLDGLLGLRAGTAELTDGYLAVATRSAAGAGIAAATMQFHGTADLRAADDTTVVARLYSDADTATSAPAVTLRKVGTAGGEAAAFAYDLARSVIATRQGNVAWAGEDRDGQPDAIRSDDLFFPGWLDMNKVAIPQADEQQRLLANLITQMNLDRTPLPRFWYLPRGGKAAVVLTGDDHGNGGTAGQFATYEADSPNGCSVADWECVRSTSYVFPSTKISDAQAHDYQRAGFEIALHLWVSGRNKGAEACNDFTASAGLIDDLMSQREAFVDKWPSLQSPVTGRNHCIVWSDWASVPKAEHEAGIRLDTNYYYWPAAWVQNRPGMFTGSGFPMRFADTDGSLIDVYQAATQLTDESGIDVDRHISALLDGALGPDGYYGVFTANMHTDKPDNPGADAIVAEAKARGVPVVSARQMLTWLDGRNGSSFRRLSFTRGRLRFAVAPAAGARGLEAMVPARGATGVLTGLTRDGAPVDVTRRTVKGIDYAMFAAAAGDYVATYPRRP